MKCGIFLRKFKSIFPDYTIQIPLTTNLSDFILVLLHPQNKLLNKFLLFSLSLFILSKNIQAQIITSEDSLYAGLIASNKQTVLSGYGELQSTTDLTLRNTENVLRRTVLFVGHKFNPRISLFTEMELENAVVNSNSTVNLTVGDISMEQVFVKFDLNPSTYLVGGLFIPRMGIINENHLPTTFNGTDRPYVEQLILPSTWRSIGIGLYGEFKRIQGLYYSLSMTNGLNSAGFNSTKGIREGRQLGSSTGMGLGLNGSLLYYINDFRIQVSSYCGGSTALEKRIADSLQLNSGTFANPIYLNEANIQYRKKGFSIKVLAAHIAIPNASEINRAFANNTSSQLFGSYAELGYNLLEHTTSIKKQLIAFSRVEYVNTSQVVPDNGILNEANKKLFILGGLTYKPIQSVSIKADYTHLLNGNQNTALIVTPFPQQTPYYTSKGFINIGLAYNF